MKIIISFNNDSFYKEFSSFQEDYFYFSHLNLYIFEIYDIKYYTFELMNEGTETLINKLKFYKEK